MLVRPEWFTHRQARWGIAPKTWQGWVYIAVFMGLNALVGLLPLPQETRRTISFTLIGLLVMDFISIWAGTGRHHDERENLHHLIIERNCSILAVMAIIAAMAWQTWHALGAAGESIPFDPAFLAVLGFMAVTKLASGLYLRTRM